MALSNYAELQAAIGTWNIDRTDLPTADLVALAEARLNRDLRLRVMGAEEQLVGVVGSRFIPLPARFLEPIGLWINKDWGREPLAAIPASTQTSTSAAQPRQWAVDGANIAFERPCDRAYGFTLRMLRAFALSDEEPVNWLLTNAPDLYLAACNLEAALYLVDDQQLGRWQARYADSLQAVNSQANRSRSVATLRTEPGLSARGGFDIRCG